jgi:MFS family permease
MPSHPDAVAADGGRGSPVSAWAPFRHRMFAAMWSAQFVSNIGSWMQTVAAQWLMLTLTGSAAYVALVQTAAGLPVVLFAIVAGTVGDLVDRRRFLLATQTFMLFAATALGALAIAGLVTPWVPARAGVRGRHRAGADLPDLTDSAAGAGQPGRYIAASPVLR